MTDLDQKFKALEFFKDFSDYMLVTTVAALGWISSQDTATKPWANPTLKPYCLWCLGLSSLFAILTLALIPLIGETMTG
jgi:hypothetical protein